jgi:hypothetical protein
MEYSTPTAPHVPSPIAASLLAGVKPSAAQTKSIKAAQAEIERLHAIIRECEPDSGNGYSFGHLHRVMDAAGEKLHAEPTKANAEAFHAACVRLETAKLSIAGINHAIHAALGRVSQSLGPVANEIVDSAIATLESEAGKSKAAVARDAGVLLDVASIDRAHAHAATDLEGHRASIASDPLGWLENHDFI